MNELSKFDKLDNLKYGQHIVVVYWPYRGMVGRIISKDDDQIMCQLLQTDEQITLFEDEFVTIRKNHEKI